MIFIYADTIKLQNILMSTSH
uniref:Uncharacterized protein n=1 Tax=Rhizophora mucronata TaxID=61149 RepID=A0A2P2PB41_RHIMU